MAWAIYATRSLQSTLSWTFCKIEENKMLKQIKSFVADENGATLIEYGLVAALIAIVAIVAMTNIGKNVNVKFSNVATTLQNN